MSPGFKDALVWLAGGTLAYLVMVGPLPSVLVGGEFIPMGPDAFYHARRILDAVQDPAGFYQFDPLIHVPEGGWLTWPWAYDLGIAHLVRAVVAVNGDWQPEKVLALVPSAAVYINALLLLGIARAIGLSLSFRAVAILCFALSPLTLALHMVGRIDHHWMEHLFVLATLFSGLIWLRDESRALPAAIFGFVMGVAPAFHNLLFVLQLPVLLTVAIAWSRRASLPRRGIGYVAAGLLAGTALAVAPSEPFQRGVFEYYYLSWFHLYVAACTVLVLCSMAFLRMSLASFAFVGGTSVLLSLPMFEQLHHGARFLSQDLPILAGILEFKSVFGHAAANALTWRESTTLYTGLIWLLPVVFAAMIVRVVRSASLRDLYFPVFCLFGGFLLVHQVRFHYFGSFVLYLPLLRGGQALLLRAPNHRLAISLGLAALLVGAYLFGLPEYRKPVAPGGIITYMQTRNLYWSLQQACDADPGTVLADHNFGHFVRYHTNCSVISNNMVLTPFEQAKALESDRLLSMTPAEIHSRHPRIKYALVYIVENVPAEESAAERAKAASDSLQTVLLRDSDDYPEGYRLLAGASRQQSDGLIVPIARAFKIVRDIPPVSRVSNALVPNGGARRVSAD